MSLTSPIFLSSVPMTSVPLNFEARNWSGDCLVTNLSAATAPVEAGAFAVVDALGVDVEALGEVVLGEAFGVEGVLVAAGGGDVDGEVLGAVEVCASALVNANVLTAATAMTCFNMSASWAIACEWVYRSPFTGVLHGQRADSGPVPGSWPQLRREDCTSVTSGGGGRSRFLARLRFPPVLGNHSLSLCAVNNRP